MAMQTQLEPETTLNTSGTSSEQLVAEARHGDQQALEQLIRHYQNPVARFVISLTGSADYEDLCQIIFVKMVLSLPRLRSLNRFEPWLYQIARNTCRDHLRERKIFRRRFVPYCADEHDELVSTLNSEAIETENTSDKPRLEAAIGQLPAAQQTLMRLWMAGGNSYEELARRTHSSISVVKSALFRARQNLRTSLVREELE